jgi:hypothetical protein
MTVILIDCSSTNGAQDVVEAVESGSLWGVSMGTTSKVSSYSHYALIECTNTRNLALMDNCPEDGSFTIEYSMNEPDSFGESGPTCKTWFLRGKL